MLEVIFKFFLAFTSLSLSPSLSLSAIFTRCTGLYSFLEGGWLEGAGILFFARQLSNVVIIALLAFVKA